MGYEEDVEGQIGEEIVDCIGGSMSVGDEKTVVIRIVRWEE